MTDQYWIAHARGCDFGKLRDKGFLVLAPTMDDYVFLEATEPNKKFLRKQTELGIAFLRGKNGPTTASKTEIDRMATKAKASLEGVEEVLVIGGIAANLEGRILEQKGEKLRLELKGYNRNYTLDVDRMDVVSKRPDQSA
jgi:hypothetical protein